MLPIEQDREIVLGNALLAGGEWTLNPEERAAAIIMLSDAPSLLHCDGLLDEVTNHDRISFATLKSAKRRLAKREPTIFYAFCWAVFGPRVVEGLSEIFRRDDYWTARHEDLWSLFRAVELRSSRLASKIDANPPIRAASRKN